MPGLKRPQVDTYTEDVHPSRKRRIGYSDDDAKLAKIYDHLADHVESVRLSAARELLLSLNTESVYRTERLKAALSRLTKGLCSGRNAARLGFSIALAEALRLAFKLAYEDDMDDFTLDGVKESVIQYTEPETKANGQVKREYLLGRRFAFQAIFQSDVAVLEPLPEQHWSTFIHAVLDLASQSQGVRAECGLMLYEFLLDVKGTHAVSRVQPLVQALQERSLLKTAEGVALWLAIVQYHPEVQMPLGVWHKNDPLSPKERHGLKKLLQHREVEDSMPVLDGKSKSKSGSRQVQPSFAWKVVLSNLYTRKDISDFEQFWLEIVEQGLFATSSSTERKAFGVQILKVAISTAPVHLLPSILGKGIVSYIISQRTETDRFLNEATKGVLSQVVTRAQTEPETAHVFAEALLTNGTLNFDQLTKTKTVEALLQHATDGGMVNIVLLLHDQIARPGTDTDGQAEARRRIVADTLLATVRSRRDSRPLEGENNLPEWLKSLLKTLIEVAFAEAEGSAQPPVTDISRSVFQSRLTSCLGILIDGPSGRAALPLDYVVICLRKHRKHLHNPLQEAAGQALESAERVRKEIDANASAHKSKDKATRQAYHLLLSLSMLEVYKQEPDGLEVLNDLVASWQLQSKGGESSAMLVELLLTFVSRQSAFHRKLAEQVFGAFAAEITAEGLQSMFDILQQKESIAGQQELFDRHEDDEDNDLNEDGNEDGVIDVEDAFDVELENGHPIEDGEEDSGDEDQSISDAEEGASDADDDEEAEFDRKLAAALGTSGVDDKQDSDDDGSDMDDEQMMALEPHLTSIFKQHKKVSSAKQDGKDAKENIVHFKNRILDLLSIYVKSQHSNPLALDLMLPLAQLTRRTKSTPTAEKAFHVLKQYFDACNKNKSLPQPADVETCFDTLTALHAELKQGGTKLHANACSRSCLFLCKVLVGMDVQAYGRIARMYADVQAEWYSDATSKVQGSVFTEWNSWSLATRKAK